MITAYIALGSNLDNPGLQLQRAVDDLDSVSGIEVTGVSKLYISKPVGPQDQPDYCNAAVEIQTNLEPLALLDATQTIENHHGRVRTIRWGARTLDLDMILYGDQVINSERLTVPHYQMHVRNFVVLPLFDINPELTLPSGRLLTQLKDELGNDGIDVMAEQYPWL
ncbi:2-amino-4-hydroxy-6-hydroxymethyldihydropteridine diphosphokinase [Endozoicomonas sp. OPT23]|uniref:2-amino-4-hydroxy-6- hydroxymethyldihydropteridine diphosphokinase n=1 Tax=Endozoicomonas sp. OPT23 TaxID=2072845 RepID=UPI00129A8E94|nr:2-amino-4-hydroxy-6-hydroxymethyldihydropteridine diphosphokinase [Endozoicomonas sp. OPT23]MRI33050.1 2-amino-4-hydroxy-6-hydroxymethyldihydropteridine diphosphokinase [Endozoicomonas sp. OPT23]